MKAGKQARVMPMAVLALLVSGAFAVQDVEARETRAAGASARTAGAPQASKSFSRQGTASAGSFAGGSRSATATVSTQSRQVRPAGTTSANQASRQSAASSTSSANQAQRQSAVSENQERRQSTSSSNQAQRQQASHENVETRQAGATTRQQARPAYPAAGYPPGYRPPAAGYYPPPPPGYYYNDDDDWDAGSAAVGFVAGAVVGAVVTDATHSSSTTSTSTSSAPPPPAPAPAPAPVAAAGLPCAPDVSSVNGVTYYRCGQSYYMQAYGPSGPVYMPVQPPEQAPAK